MDATLSINEIENTKAWKGLNNIQQSFAVKRKNRELITNALIVYRSIGSIPGNIHGYNLAIVQEMILGEQVKFQLELAKEIQKDFIKAKKIIKKDFKGIADSKIYGNFGIDPYDNDKNDKSDN